MSFECNLKANRIGKITLKNFYDFKLSLDKISKTYKVTGKDGHVWGEGASTKGAVISACRCGIRLKDIDLSEAYVPMQEVISCIKD